MYRLRENNDTITIDGFTLGLDSSFVPTKDWVRAKLRVFNRTYFDNKLEVEQLPIKVYPYKGYAGFVMPTYRYNKATGEILSFTITRLGISNYCSRSELDFATILLHEMIHLYQFEVLHRLDIVNGKLDSHSTTFTDKMYNINSHGWHIGVTETFEQSLNRGAVSQKVIQRQERKNDAEKYTIVFCVPEYYYTSPLLPRDYVEFFIVKNDEFQGILENFVAPLEKRRNICFWSEIKKDSSWYSTLVKSNLFTKSKRISINTFDKQSRWGDYSDWEPEQYIYVMSRMWKIKYEGFVTVVRRGDLYLHQIGATYSEYNDNELPPEENRVKESVPKKEKKHMTSKEFVDCLEADPYLTVTSVEEDDDIVSVGAILI
jgi:hypothetical protein